MRIVPVLALAFLTALTAPATALVEPPATPLPVGNGVFFDFGETVATVTFRILQGDCDQPLLYLYLNRHFLSADKVRYVWADLTCVRAADGTEAWVVIGNEALTPASNLKLAGGKAAGTIALAGTYRDGYMAVHVP